jgi:hypothetical protein
MLTTAGAAAFAVAGMIASGAGPASATGITDLGRIDGTHASFAGCQGWVHGGSASNTVYARGEFSLPKSTRGLTCFGWLERRSSSTSAWTHISGTVATPDTTTGWYYDSVPYTVRVCVGDLEYTTSYSCAGTY